MKGTMRERLELDLVKQSLDQETRELVGERAATYCPEQTEIINRLLKTGQLAPFAGIEDMAPQGLPRAPRSRAESDRLLDNIRAQRADFIGRTAILSHVRHNGSPVPIAIASEVTLSVDQLDLALMSRTHKQVRIMGIFVDPTRRGNGFSAIPGSALSAFHQYEEETSPDECTLTPALPESPRAATLLATGNFMLTQSRNWLRAKRVDPTTLPTTAIFEGRRLPIYYCSTLIGDPNS